jgi:hypothetical protein
LLLPVAHELHRAARSLTRGPRSWRTKLRVLPSKTRGMAILCAGGQALAWRIFPWSTNDPIGPIEAAVRLLASHAREELGIEGIDGVLVHCGTKHADFAAKCGDALGVPAEAGGRMIVDEALVASALASSALGWKPGDANLFDELVPEGAELARFPVTAVATLGVAMFSAAGVLCVQASSAAESAARLEASVSNEPSGAAPATTELMESRIALTSEVELAQSFLDSRTLWTPFLKELPDLLPPATTLTGFDGRCAPGAPNGATSTLAAPSGATSTPGAPVDPVADSNETIEARSKRATIMAETPADSAAHAPPEAALLVDRVRASRIFESSFGKVATKTTRLPGAAHDVARIEIVCTPKGD